MITNNFDFPEGVTWTLAGDISFSSYIPRGFDINRVGPISGSDVLINSASGLYTPFLSKSNIDGNLSPLYVDIKGCTSFNNAFSNRTNLKYVYFDPIVFGADEIDFSEAFKNSSNLISVCLDTGEADDSNKKVYIKAAQMFYGCTNFIDSVNDIEIFFSSISRFSPNIYFSDAQQMFQGCTNLRRAPKIRFGSADPSAEVQLSSIFNGCTNLRAIDDVDFSGVTSFTSTFQGCTSLTDIPLIDTSSATKFENVFYNCTSLKTIPALDFSNVTSINYAFRSCTALESLPLLDCSSVTNTSGPFQRCSSLTNIGGFKDLKVGFTRYFLNECPNVTAESLMNVINNLYDLTANGMSGQSINFGSANLAKLTDDQIAVAASKGWTLV